MVCMCACMVCLNECINVSKDLCIYDVRTYARTYVEVSHIALYIDAATHAQTSGVLFQWTPTALVGWAPSDVWVDVGHAQPRHADLITSLSCLHAWRGRALGAADDDRILISGARLC